MDPCKHDDRALLSSSADLHKNFDTLSRTSSSSRSSSVHSVTPAEPPRLIILGLWPGARDEQIDYYMQGYETLYPHSGILLLHHSRKKSTQNIESVLNGVLGDFEKRSPRPGQHVLIHLFGDDAATQVCRFLRAYRASTDETLGVRAIILDSVPVAVAPSLRSIQTSPQQLLLLLYLLLASFLSRLVSIMVFWFWDPFNEQVREDLHDPRLLHADARKCYIFPDKGIMFAWDQPRHDEDVCERQEFDVKRRRVDGREKWSGNQERYWLGIESAWEGR